MDKKKARQEADALVDAFVDAIIKRLAGMAEAAVKEQMTELEKRILARLPEVVHIPPRPVDAPRERLLNIGEVAEVLGCKKDKVHRLMRSGALTYISISDVSDFGERKVPYTWLLEFIYSQKRYAGASDRRREVLPSEGQGADCAEMVKKNRLRRVS